MKARFWRWWDTLPFRWQIFVFMATTVTFTVLMVEMVFEPLVEGNFDIGGGDIDWHEVPLWLIGAGIQGLLSAALMTRMVMSRLDRLAKVAGEIADGNLSARIPEGGDDKDAFNRLARRFNRMADTVEQLLLNERRLLSDISHELRSPLTRIGAALELASLGNGGQHLRLAAGEVVHMNHLIGVLLEQNNNRLAVREGRERLDAGEMAEELAEGFRMVGATERKSLTLAVEPALYVEGHPMQLRLILENLLSNAMFYTPAESRAELRVERQGNRVAIGVRDYGPGVPEEQMDAIFRPFYRVDSSRTRKSGGVGLGLTLVREAVHALGGKVEAENMHPGLRVAVTLPLAEEMAGDSRRGV